jgi:DNA-binding transcriptional LysR family regulator
VTTGFARVDLRKGEADLAVRLGRPTDPRLACRRLGDFALRLYASRDYVATHGMPATLDGRPLLAYEEAVRTGGRHPFANLPMERGELALLSNSHHVLVAGASSGLGIVQLPSFVGDEHPDLVRVLADAEEPYSVWLVVPQANRRIAAVRAVSEAIAEAFRRRVARRPGSLSPPPPPSPPPRPSPSARSPRRAAPIRRPAARNGSP